MGTTTLIDPSGKGTAPTTMKTAKVSAIITASTDARLCSA